MKLLKSIAVLLTLTSALALAKDKKVLPALFSNARYVYVQAEDGDIMKPGLFPEDREAIANVQDAMKDWHRYTLTLNRSDADLIIIVRKGRLAAAQLHGGVTAGAPTGVGGAYPNRNPGAGNSDPSRNPDPADGGYNVGARGEVGPPDDILLVFSLSTQGRLSGPLWSGEMKDGLDAPNVMLLRSLRDAVDRAYPPQPAAQKKP